MIDRPIIFHNPLKVPSGAKIIEAFNNAVDELSTIDITSSNKAKKSKGVWVYYPWLHIAVHTIDEDLYFKLRTNRNRDIITTKEQLRYRNLTIGIAGLSVGSSILSSLVISGGPKFIKIADFDTIEISNLNRIRASLKDVGENKAVIAARDVWGIDPFAKLDVWQKGLEKKKLNKFLSQSRKLDIFVDEMDNIELKIQTRLLCRRLRIPVIMATDNGDGVIIDVERYDKEPKRDIFHGLLKGVKIKEAQHLTRKQWFKLANKIIGPEYLGPKMKASLDLIGKKITGIPQLGTSAQIAGASVAYVVRKIANKQDMPSGRFLINLDNILK